MSGPHRRTRRGLLTLGRNRAPAAPKHELKPWQKQPWCIPAVRAEFVAALEEVLELYEAPYDPPRPTVNVDEPSQPLIAETRTPWPPPPGQPERYDDEDKRHGSRHLLIICAPQAGWRHLAVTAQRTMTACGHQRQGLVEERYPAAEGIRVVLDHLNTHKPASLYETCEPAEARRRLRRLACHDTPQHGSWLHMAELELRVLSRPCLDRRLPDDETLKRELNAYEAKRNAAKATIDWRFTSREARVKRHRLYPSISR